MAQREGKHAIRDMLAGTKDLFILPPTIELTDNTQATVLGTKGILEYTDELIRVSFANMEVCFYGTRLSISSLSQDSLEIKGRIERLEYR